jgi:hypothetical protein
MLGYVEKTEKRPRLLLGRRREEVLCTYHYPSRASDSHWQVDWVQDERAALPFVGMSLGQEAGGHGT